ncbi:hypothetical protein CTI12_AA466750 [Artemisia annua]|uniref:Uncharacterized protein n=1 Tax=Artemisia annua TaxID=35608 RepID=A0A2U1LQD5_ARTAN|nr:hypothetical protein CTI12_AA466750 [Artemisia annua]
MELLMTQVTRTSRIIICPDHRQVFPNQPDDRCRADNLCMPKQTYFFRATTSQKGWPILSDGFEPFLVKIAPTGYKSLVNCAGNMSELLAKLGFETFDIGESEVTSVFMRSS